MASPLVLMKFDSTMMTRRFGKLAGTKQDYESSKTHILKERSTAFNDFVQVTIESRTCSERVRADSFKYVCSSSMQEVPRSTLRMSWHGHT